MRRASVSGVSVLVPILLGVVTTGVAQGQSRRDCAEAGPIAIGFTMGRALTPLFELSRDTFETLDEGSIQPRGGLHLGGRADLPIAGAWRGRVEVSGSNWPVEHQTYDADARTVQRSSVGHVESRQLLAFIGRQGGRRPACGYVLAGGGAFSLRAAEARMVGLGAAIAAGVEAPVGSRGALQFEAQVHMIRTGARPPMTTGALAANLSVAWLFRF